MQKIEKAEFIDEIEDIIIFMQDTARVNTTFKTTTRSKDDDDKIIQGLQEILEELNGKNRTV